MLTIATGTIQLMIGIMANIQPQADSEECDDAIVSQNQFKTQKTL